MGMTSKEAIETLIFVHERNNREDYALEMAIEALHLLEKKEQGLVVEIPCKVGDTAYFPYIDGTTKEKVISPWIVTGIALKKDGWYAMDDDGNCDKIGGEYCYLTREEAEQTLKAGEING